MVQASQPGGFVVCLFADLDHYVSIPQALLPRQEHAREASPADFADERKAGNLLSRLRPTRRWLFHEGVRMLFQILVNLQHFEERLSNTGESSRKLFRVGSFARLDSPAEFLVRQIDHDGPMFGQARMVFQDQPGVECFIRARTSDDLRRQGFRFLGVEGVSVGFGEIEAHSPTSIRPRSRRSTRRTVLSLTPSRRAISSSVSPAARRSRISRYSDGTPPLICSHCSCMIAI